MVSTVCPSACAASIVQLLTDTPVNMDHAGATLTGVATHMNARETEVTAEQIHQQRGRRWSAR